MGSGPAARLALVVSSWYPAPDDPVIGRFVADQVAAVVADGRFSPAVVTFEEARLMGGIALRERQLAALRTLTGDAIRGADALFAAGPSPLARLTVARGRVPETGARHSLVHRQDVLRALGDRLLGDGITPAVIHAHGGYPDAAATVELADRFDRPLIVTEHASFVDRYLSDPAFRPDYEAAVRRACRLVAVSETLAAELRAALPELAERIMVIPNAIDVEPFVAARRSAEPPTGTGERLIFVGYRKDTKGVEVLLRAFADLRHRRPAATLRMVGRSLTAEDEAGWIRLAGELGVRDAVAFDPPADRAGVAAALAASDLFVHPSPRETFGIVAVEALAAGVPVVAMDSGGVTEIVGRGVGPFGEVVESGEPAALAVAIDRTLDRRAGFDADAAAATMRIRYGAAAVGSRIADLYETAIAERGGPVVASPAVDLPIARSAAPNEAVIVGFDRSAVDELLRLLPASIQEGVDVVTGSMSKAGPAAPIRRRITVEVALVAGPSEPRPAGGGTVRRIVRRLRSLLASAGDARGARELAVARDVVARALEAAPQASIVCLDGLAHLVVALALEGSGSWSGRRVLPGGLRAMAERAGVARGVAERDPTADDDEDGAGPADFAG